MLTLEDFIKMGRAKIALQKRREAGKKYYRNNIEKLKEKNRRWRKDNPDKYYAGIRRWEKENPTKKNGYTWKVKKGNPKYVEKRIERYKAIKPSFLVSSYKKEIKEIYARAKAITKETGVKHVVDHIMPLIGPNFRGLHVPWNMQIITFEENTKKSNKVL